MYHLPRRVTIVRLHSGVENLLQQHLWFFANSCPIFGISQYDNVKNSSVRQNQ